jgi:protein-disulfide isomerase
MMKNNNQSLIIAILVAAVFIGGSMIFLGTRISSGESSQAEIEAGIETYIAKQQAEAAKAQEEANQPKFVEGDFSDDDPVLGDKNAPVTIVEWSDFECPFCGRFFKDTLPQIKKNYIDTGKVKLIYRDFPLPFHEPAATREAIAADCAREQGGDKTFFAYHDMIFTNTKANGQGVETDQLYDMAKQLDLDENQFRECVESEKYKEEIAKDIADGRRAGINGTPGFLINGRLVSGAQPYAVFEQIIGEALK